ncbi:hypothetical protein L1049_027590 [Liquidambar formosana]|uniref:Purple acid phosphatase n=1 Tax=Liquidambar formosana TaxID=63359 RepID=A0AAP0WVK9_LIQFO
MAMVSGGRGPTASVSQWHETRRLRLDGDPAVRESTVAYVGRRRGCGEVGAELQQLEHPVKDDGSLSFLVIGDWGRRGTYNQTQVALQMGRIGEKLNIDFVVSYRGDVEAQLSPILGRIDSRWLCSRSFLLNTEIAEFFFIDTTPFVDKYFEEPKHHTYDWRGVIPRNEYLSNLLKDLELGLRVSNAKWKIVIGHHTMRSVGHHGETKELVLQLLPILEANNVDMYINGHDHCLEHISTTKSPIQFLTSGGGSKAWKGDIDDQNRHELKFYYDGQGFMSVQLTQTHAEIVFYDVFGGALHNLKLTRQLYSAL